MVLSADKYQRKSNSLTGLVRVSEVVRLTGAYEIVCIKHIASRAKDERPDL